jgi:hypothetical protein
MEFVNLRLYLNVIAAMVQVPDLGDQPKDLRDSSYYVTRILNGVMADLCLMKSRKKDRNFNMTALMTPEEHTELCELTSLIFERCVQHKTLKANLKEFTEKNGYDFYYRFLCYLQSKSELVAFNRLCLGMVKLVSQSDYLLPDMYRTASICLLLNLAKADPSLGQHRKPATSQSAAIFCSLSLCRLNKFFFYDTPHKRLLADTFEQCFIKKAPVFSCTLASVLEGMDKRLNKLALQVGLLFGVTAADTAHLDEDEVDEDEPAAEPSGKKIKYTKTKTDLGSDNEKSTKKSVKKIKDAKSKDKKLKIDDDAEEDDKKDKKSVGKKIKKSATKDLKDSKLKTDSKAKIDDKGKSKDKKTKDVSPSPKKVDKGKSKDKKTKDPKEDKGKSKDKKTKDEKGKSKDKKPEKEKDKKSPRKSPSKKKKVDGEDGANVGADPVDSEDADEEDPVEEEDFSKVSLGSVSLSRRC